MSNLINRIYAALAAAGLTAISADMFGLVDIPDNTGAKAVTALAIVFGLLWQSLPDEDGTAGPDVLQGAKLDFKAWFKNIVEAVRYAAAPTALALLLCACGTVNAAARVNVCQPAYSDNCLLVDFVATEDGAEFTVLEHPDASMSVEMTAEMPGIQAAGTAAFDPVEQEASAHACVNALFWERCAEVTTED